MTADTSVVVAALSAWHEHHEEAAQALAKVTALPAHALLEAYSVLTRLPSGLAAAPTLAVTLLGDRFPDPPLRLTARDHAKLLDRLAVADVYGGASYDALVALEAQAHDETLLTLDRRAQLTYQRLGVRFQVVAARGS